METLNISLGKLVPFSRHPFNIYEGKRKDDMVDSIRDHGVITPIIVRPLGDGYEILSGHNRVNAARILDFAEIPAVVKEVDDDEAFLIVTETNLVQRSFADLLHSERAVILDNHIEALKALRERGKDLKYLADVLDDFEESDEDDEEFEDGVQVAHHDKSRDKVAEKYSISGDTVRRYQRIAKLPKEILDKVDSGAIKLTPAVELSYLAEEELDDILSLFAEDENLVVSLRNAKELRSKSGELDGDDIKAILYGTKPKEKKTTKNFHAKFSKKTRNKIEEYKISDRQLEEAVLAWIYNKFENPDNDETED
jgi:ParB family chromosome partitioning protein